MSKAPNPKSMRARKSIAHPSDISFDKENTFHGTTATSTAEKSTGRKLRSKSLGPGGLEALQEAQGNRQEIFAAIKSILKPTIPLSPLQPLSSTSEKGSSPGRSKQGTSPSKLALTGPPNTPGQTGLDNVPNPFDDQANEASGTQKSGRETRVSLRTEAEQQAAARAKEKQDIIERRDARRKSLANRRVSFAPEATLHTWDVVELAEDATSSSEATNSTRRASSGSTLTASSFPADENEEDNQDDDEPPSTPEAEQVQVLASPAHQGGVHQKKRRRSSGIPPMNFNNPEDFSSSPGSSVGSDDTNHTSMIAEDEIDASDSDEDKDLVVRDETVTGVDLDDNTSHSIASGLSNASSTTGLSARLDAALRQAAQQAGTQGIEFDENGDATMELADDEVTASFKPFHSTGAQATMSNRQSHPMLNQENINPFSPAFKASFATRDAENDDQEQTMDFTQAAGIILSANAQSQPSPKRGRRKSIAPGRRRSGAAHRRLSGDSSADADESMDLTMAIGGIENVQPQQSMVSPDSGSNDEDLTMEFTSIVGGLVERDQNLSREGATSRQSERDDNRRFSIGLEDDAAMDMTAAVGAILSPVTERTEPLEDETLGMDFTAAVGGILPKDLHTNDKSVAKMLMEEEADHGQLTRSPFMAGPSTEPIATGLMSEHSVSASENGSPSLLSLRSRNARRSAGSNPFTTPSRVNQDTTPLKKPSTPHKQVTPRPERPSIPSKTPPSKNVSIRKPSPKRLFKAEIAQVKATTPKSTAPFLTFHQDTVTGLSIPSIVLTPKPRRSSGIGIDKEGLGSPRIAALLDRRTSIGERIPSFTPNGLGTGIVRFEDPQAMERELDKERAELLRRESGRDILETEGDMPIEGERDVTTNLREMIQSLTPKKNKLKGRKSLHVGAAKGLLGKRPVELDEEEDEDRTPKRLKGQDRSPVKSIKLPAPPSKMETTGRLGKAPRFNLGLTSGNVQVTTPTLTTSPNRKAASPKGQTRFKDAGRLLTDGQAPVSFNEQLAGAVAHIEPVEEEEEDERIHLQDFLNLTSIRFMELTTTKRRHTVAPSNGLDDSVKRSKPEAQGDINDEQEREVESCVVAGACTVPMLELYQHSCRELKKYISEGRSIVHEIESDTYEENPALFREYLSASPDVRAIMDIQFKNVKTHARLLSKAMWYEWRMKLLEGLKEGLVRIGDGLISDTELLSHQEELLQSVVPDLIAEYDRAYNEADLLKSQADELANCDQEELTEAREKLVSVEAELEARKLMIEELQSELRQQEQGIEQVTDRKEECLAEIAEAERVREECRGWSAAEVAALKVNVDELERSTGWSITFAFGPSLTLTYKHDLQLLLTPSSFLPTATSAASPISLQYVGDSALSTERRFFLQLLCARLHALPQSHTPLRHVLDLVSSGWQCAERVADAIRSLRLAFMAEAAIAGDEALTVSASILLREMRTRVTVAFELFITTGGDAAAVDLGLRVSARVVYGETLNEARMTDFLAQRVRKDSVEGADAWADALRDLETRLKARGRKNMA